MSEPVNSWSQNFLATGVKALLIVLGNCHLWGADLKKLLISSSINTLFTSSDKMPSVKEVSLFPLRIVIAVAPIKWNPLRFVCLFV